MYKKRITRWQLFKNYKSSEKEQIARSLEVNGHSGLEQHLTVRGAPVKMHRIDRHRRERNQVVLYTPDDTSAFGQNLITSSDFTKTRRPNTLLRRQDTRSGKRAQIHHRVSIISGPAPGISDLPEHRDTNILLWHIENYFSWKLGDEPTIAWESWTESADMSRSPERISYTFQERTYECVFESATDVFDRFRSATSCLQRGAFHAAWKMVNEGAAMAQACLRQEHPCMLSSLYSLLGYPHWRYYPEILNDLLQLLVNMASIVCGSLHPITVILRMIFTSQKSTYAIEVGQNKLLDVVQCRLSETHGEILLSKLEVCTNLISQEKFDQGERSLRKFIEMCERLQGRDGVCTRLGLFQMGWSLVWRGRLDEAEGVLADTLERGMALGAEEFVNIRANGLMGYIYARQGEYKVAEIYLWRALYGSLLAKGPRDPETVRSWIQYQGTMHDARQVREAEEIEQQNSDSLDDREEDESRSYRISVLRSGSVDYWQELYRGRGLKRARRGKRRERGKSCTFFNLRAY